MDNMLRVGLVGAGLIGSRRAAVVYEDPSAALVMVADAQSDRAEEAAARWGTPSCKATREWEEVVCSSELDVVIISTINKFLAPITIAALQNGKHVLCEKPMGRNLAEAEQMAEAAQPAGKVLKIGFNHRFHPGIQKAHELCVAGEIGPLFYVRCVYGHGGRPGYEKEWRGDAELAGGGELLDQGVHVVDLCRWFLGEFAEIFGNTATCFWDLGYFEAADSQQQTADGGCRASVVGRLEDNAFVLLRTADGRVAQFHTSWTQWKNCFLFEIYGRDGSLRIEGLGGSYGPERLVLAKRRPEPGPPEEKFLEFSGTDDSWKAEWAEFTAAIREGRRPLGDAGDGLEAMRLIDAIYRSARVGQLVCVDHEVPHG